MSEEAYEMTRSHSGASNSTDQYLETYNNREEEARLLNKEEQSDSGEEEVDDEDEDWAIIVEETNGELTQEFIKENPIIKYICIGLAIGVCFVIFRIAIVKISEGSHHHVRGAEKLYYNGSDYFASTVVLISLDGFKPDYLDRDITPNMKQLAEKGVMAKYMHPAFPPSTFPNHWTLVTGLYPETHGIVANVFYDPNMDATFSHSNFSSTIDHKWWGGEPIWTTSRYNRKRSGSIMWPGSETNYNPPDLVVRFNSTMGIKEKIDTTLKWLDLPYNDRPQIITVYVPQIDQEGHRSGPNGPKMNRFIKEVDDAIGYLAEQLKQRRLDDYVHTLIVSDHGMAEINSSKLIYYDDIISNDVLSHLKNREASPLLDFRPKSNAPKDTIKKLYEQLYNYTQNTTNAHFEVYLRENVPERYHYNNSDRITPIVAIPEVGYSFTTHAEVEKEGGFKKGGNHGYDNLAADMRAIFIAKGPKIQHAYRPGSILAPFFNIEVYGLLSELLNMDAAPNNGTLKAKFPIIYQPPFYK
ncbi:alkaline-phosphatase-like protein [Cokeromyces recurvatus]|uniref:alkaline-phosphatase-like protein n=1 Tax=Cokeromyces recurvatus TaxID=90255 RepID=UPI00221EA18E|nr:alkaline-phosphatase-like protein [Cokeromyces recurvatus]KAI7905086.1 alkaline-phosphatase-like protein [Cokeromyces recurvatus]